MSDPSDAPASAAARSSSSPLGLLVDAVILAPIGVGATAIELIPDLVARGRQQVVLARFIGKMVVDHGVAELRRRLSDDDAPASVNHRADESADIADDVPPAPLAPPERGGPSISSEAADLVLPDYDHLPAAHIVAKLGSLDPAERDAIERYETEHRHRRTILGKLAQLRA